MVERLDVMRVGRAAGLQQFLYQIDAAARAVALVAADHIGRAGRGAEAAMHAGAQDLFQDSAVCGSASCAAEKWVCIRYRVHAAGIERGRAGRGSPLTPRVICSERRATAAEHIDAGASSSSARISWRGRQSAPAPRAPRRGRLGRVGREPHEAAALVEQRGAGA